MQIIDATYKSIEIKDFKKRHAEESDASILIKDDTLLVENGKPIILYKKIDWCDTTELRNCCMNIEYTKDTRVPKRGEAGMITRSAIFGYKPRSPLRQNFCSATSMAMKSPREHKVIAEFAKNLNELYEKYFPETYLYHKEKVKQVKDEWIIDGSVFTSGIINKNNPLKYHHDSGNFKGVLSNMIAFKSDVGGGRLVMPEYNIKLEIADNTVSIFDGQSIVHGVTPIVKNTKDAYRYTIVYYSLEQMWKCDTIKEEILRIRKLKKEKEFKRLQTE